MRSKRTVWLRLAWRLIRMYGVEIWVILVFANLVAFVSVRLLAVGSNCMSPAAMASDNRCLYVYKGDIYSQGTKSRPHKGHACGMDVSSIIPNNHIGNTAKYLLPNYVAKVCVGSPPSPTPLPPTAAPTVVIPASSPTPSTPPSSPTVTRAPTVTQTQNNPTSTPGPTITVPVGGGAATAMPTAGSTPQPPTPTALPTSGAIQTPIASPTPVSQAATPTLTPGNNSEGSGFGGILDQLALGPRGLTPTGVPSITDLPTESPDAPGVTVEALSRYNFVFWSTWLVYLTFGLLVGVAILWLAQKVRRRRKRCTTP